MSAVNRSELLAKVPLFEGLPSSLLDRISEQLRVREVPQEHILFYEGDDGGSLFIVIEGKLAVQTVSESGVVRHIADRGVGEHVGELSLIDDEPRSADVVALTPCKLFVLNRKEFEKAVLECPELGINLMRSLAKRLREQSTRVTKHSSLDVLGRLSMALLELAQNGVVHLSQRSIGERIGATRETVNRSIGQLADLGAIRVGQGEIKILDRKYLESRSQPV